MDFYKKKFSPVIWLLGHTKHGVKFWSDPNHNPDHYRVTYCTFTYPPFAFPLIRSPSFHFPVVSPSSPFSPTLLLHFSFLPSSSPLSCKWF